MLKGAIRYTKALTSLAATGLAGFASEKARTKILSIDAPPPKPWKPVIPAISFTELGATSDRAHFAIEAAADGNVSPFELVALGTLAARPGVKQIFEIGTFNGLTALNFAINSSAETKIFTLDLPPENKGDTALKAEFGDNKFIVEERKGWLFHQGRRSEEKKVTQLLGDSATFEYSPYRNACDLVFVDGAHSYDYVKKDTETALTLLRDGHGVIIWHDYNTWWPGVIRYLEELHKTAEFASIRRIAGTSIVVLIR